MGLSSFIGTEGKKPWFGHSFSPENVGLWIKSKFSKYFAIEIL